MKIAVDCGHTLKNADTGAQGCLGREEDRTREIGVLVMNKLKALKHTVINCTVDNANSVTESLQARVNKANSNNADVFVSIHLNAFNNQAHGTEVYISPHASRKSKEIAQKVVRELAQLGFRNRGVNTNNLYVCNHTTMPAILVECCFVDSEIDKKLYNADKIAKAIVYGLVGSKATSTSSSSQNNFVKQLQQTLNKTRNANLVVDGIAGPLTLGACPMLQAGSMGEITRILQTRLTNLGYSTNGIDGMFGQNTKKAVMNFQKSKKLLVDGIVGRNTWSKLLGLS